MKSDIATALAVLNTFTGPDLSSKIRSLENAMTDLGAEDATAFLVTSFAPVCISQRKQELTILLAIPSFWA